jgi:glutamate N-acetyltransferase / amino-acid N-acetyltransferase
VKTAIFGADANWGRILCAIGYSGMDVSSEEVAISFESGKGYLTVYENNEPVDFSEEKAKEILSESEIQIIVELKRGEYEAVAWGCDLTYEYVRINGDYRS